MGKRHSPRNGSMQFWPHVRAKRSYPSVHAVLKTSDVKPLDFTGYKVGMTHIQVKDTYKNSLTKNQVISIPVTVIECPNLKIYGVRFYTKKGYGLAAYKDVLNNTLDKELSRRLDLPKKKTNFENDLKTLASNESVVDLKILVHTLPGETGIGKKKPEVFELSLGGSDLSAKIDYVLEHKDSGISLKDVFEEGSFIDVHAVTKGKGFQGAVKRFGIDIRSRKSEKTKRGAGSLGGWIAQGHVMYRIPSAGKAGYNNRVDYNKKIMSISDDLEKVNVKGGFIHYGVVKNSYLLLKGSVPGAKGRLIRMVKSIRLNPKVNTDAPVLVGVSTESPQGR